MGGEPFSFLVESTQSMIGIVGLSATLPNYSEVAQFLSVNAQLSLFFFDGSYRPVPLAEQYVRISELNFVARMELLNEKVTELLTQGHQVMVFVHSRKDTCKTADNLVHVHAIRGLPHICKDTPEHVSKIVDILVQILNAEENVERDAVVKALLSLLRQDVKASLTALFNHIESSVEQSEENREGTLSFIKKSIQDVTGGEFKMFIDFLKSLSIPGNKASPKRIQELIEIIDSQADVNAQFNVDDGDHIERLIRCIYKAIPILERGASSSKFLKYPNKHLLPDFDKMERSLTAVIALIVGGNLYMGADSKRSGQNPPFDVFHKVHWLSPTIALIGAGSSRLYSAIKDSINSIIQLQHLSDISQVVNEVKNYLLVLLATGNYPTHPLVLTLGGSHGTNVYPVIYFIRRGFDANGNSVVTSSQVSSLFMVGSGRIGMSIYRLLHPLHTIDIADAEVIKRYIVGNVANAILWSPSTCGPPIEVVFIPTPDRLPAMQETYVNDVLTNQYFFCNI